MENSICNLFKIRYPIIQAGMIWVSGGKLAAASANAGILGILGAGSMKPDLLRAQIQKAKILAPGKPLGVNLPLLYQGAPEQIEVALDEGIRNFITSAGSPKKYTSYLKDKGCVVTHVCSTPRLAEKCQEAGVDAIVAEGFEAGGHNGRDELTTMVLIPQVRQAVDIPIIAAGGIGTGAAIAACLALGADAVQIGSRFAASIESSAHQNFKQAIVDAKFDSTKLCLKRVVPVRLLHNPFQEKVMELESKGATKDQLTELLGKGRAKKGMLEGDMEEGELEIGQISGLINDIKNTSEIVQELVKEYKETLENMQSW